MDARADIALLEDRALHAWPCLRSTMIGGWVLRLADGYTKRANSANPVRPAGSFAEVQRAAEDVYAAAGLPAIFRITPLAQPEADACLDRAGYALCEPTLVMTAPPGDRMPDHRAAFAAAPSPTWLAGVAGASGRSRADQQRHAQILGMIRAPRTFVTIHDQGQAIGFGMAVADRGQIGLFDIAVAPKRRGEGIGRAVTQALMAWGAANGAGRAYLQVGEANMGALRLYRSLGFTARYGYHYRVRQAR